MDMNTADLIPFPSAVHIHTSWIAAAFAYANRGTGVALRVKRGVFVSNSVCAVALDARWRYLRMMEAKKRTCVFRTLLVPSCASAGRDDPVFGACNGDVTV